MLNIVPSGALGQPCCELLLWLRWTTCMPAVHNTSQPAMSANGTERSLYLSWGPGRAR